MWHRVDIEPYQREDRTVYPGMLRLGSVSTASMGAGFVYTFDEELLAISKEFRAVDGNRRDRDGDLGKA